MKGLSKDQIELITTKVIEIHEEQRVVGGKKEQSRRLRNTKLLLRNYRTFKKYEEKIKGETEAQWVEVSKKELLVLGEDLVSSIKQTTQRTLVMIRLPPHNYDDNCGNNS